MGFIAQYAVAHIVKVRDLHSAKQKAILELTRVSKHAARANNHISPDVSAGPDLCSRTNPAWSLNDAIRGQLNVRRQPNVPFDRESCRYSGPVQTAFEREALRCNLDLRHPLPRASIRSEEHTSELQSREN